MTDHEPISSAPTWTDTLRHTREIVQLLGGIIVIVGASVTALGFVQGWWTERGDAFEARIAAQITEQNAARDTLLAQQTARRDQELAAKLASIDARLDALTPAPRVTVEGMQTSYVRKPVHLGEAISVILYIGRSQYGLGCRLLSRTPMFVDDNGVARAGDTEPSRRQLTGDTARVEIDIPLPDDMPTGFATVSQQLHYSCDGRDVFEETSPVAFEVLPERTGNIPVNPRPDQ